MRLKILAGVITTIVATFGLATSAWAYDNGLGQHGCTQRAYLVSLTAGGQPKGDTTLIKGVSIQGGTARWNFNFQLDPNLDYCPAFIHLSNGQTVILAEDAHGSFTVSSDPSVPSNATITSIQLLAEDASNADPPGSTCGNAYELDYNGGTPTGSTTHIQVNPSTGPYTGQTTWSLVGSEMWCNISGDDSGSQTGWGMPFFTDLTQPFSHTPGGTMTHFVALAMDMPTLRADLTPPSAPMGVKATGGNGSITLSGLNGSTQSDFSHDDLYRANANGSCPTALGGASRLRVYPPATTHQLSGLTNGQSYKFCVTAVDTTGNESAPAVVSATPQTPPAAPTLTFEKLTSSRRLSTLRTRGTVAGDILAHGNLNQDCPCGVKVMVSLGQKAVAATAKFGGPNGSFSAKLTRAMRQKLHHGSRINLAFTGHDQYGRVFRLEWSFKVH